MWAEHKHYCSPPQASGGRGGLVPPPRPPRLVRNAGGGVLAVEGGEDFVERRLFVGEGDGEVEEDLGGDREELAGVGGAVGVEEVAALAGPQQAVLLGADLDPA